MCQQILIKVFSTKFRRKLFSIYFNVYMLIHKTGRRVETAKGIDAFL
jgi:hypothetical protein